MTSIWPLGISLAVFAASAVAIALIGVRLTQGADRLADRTGLGEAVFGAVLLGGLTSLPGITASVTAAATGYPVLALSNAFGGIAAQTAFLAIADIAHPKINLEHAAAEVGNMMQGALLISLLSLLMLGIAGPQISVFGVHPVTPVLLVGYIFGVRLVHASHRHPMWSPRMTGDTRVDEPQETPPEESLVRLWAAFVLHALIIIGAGWLLTRSAISISKHTGLGESLVGGLLVAVVTSLPELVTSVAAVRQGALTMAVSGILGGNAFDTIFAAVSDIAYRPGSIYAAATRHETTLLSLTILMTSILLLGLLQREKRGFANIGFESVFVLILYVLGVILLGT